MKHGQSVFQADAELYLEASNAAFNICCVWLAENGHEQAGNDLADFLNSDELEALPERTLPEKCTDCGATTGCS